MAVWISTTNYAKGITPTSASTSATGYSLADVADGVLGRAWRTSTSATSHSITFDLGSAKAVSLVCVFDAKSSTGAWGSPNIDVLYSSDNITYGSAGTGSFTSRGDYMLDVRVGGAAFSRRYWRFTFKPSSSSAIEVGEIWIGTLTVLTRGFADRSDSVEYRTIVNESDTGNEFATAVADYRHRFALGWDAMTSANLTEFRTVHEAVAGRRNAFVLVPDHTAGVAYHGRIGDELAWEHDDPIRKGVGLEFVESGRAL